MLSFQIRSHYAREEQVNSTQYTKYVKSWIRWLPETFLSSGVCNKIILGLTEQLELNNKNQVEMDVWYHKFCNCLCMEFEKCAKNNQNTPKESRKLCKPYLNQDLRILWDSLRAAEKKFLMWKQGTERVAEE